MINLILAPEIVHYMQQVCLAQAQECILEKSMLDNRKATIIGKHCIRALCLVLIPVCYDLSENCCPGS